MLEELIAHSKNGNAKSLARAISLIENDEHDFISIMQNLSFSDVPVIGITGPPGAGKSTITDALIEVMLKENKKIGVLCIDPSSPFNKGALLGDRIRMSSWYNHPSVFIRSLASRGNMGGLHPKIIEITDVMKAANFDYIIIETVGVGQSEVEIAGLANVTVVVLVPEGGDDIQAMKSGLMEIADIFVVNKCDRPGADSFVHNIHQLLMLNEKKLKHEAAVVKTVASEKTGIDELYREIEKYLAEKNNNEKKIWLMTERAYLLIEGRRMKNIDKDELSKTISKKISEGIFNLYKMVEEIDRS